VPYRKIAEQFELSEAALSRHLKEHIAPYVSRLRDEEGMRAALDVVEQLREINDAAKEILDEAREADEWVPALQAIDRVQKKLEFQAKLMGDIDERPQVNVMIDQRVQTALLEALRPYPEAGYAVAEALKPFRGIEE